MKKTRLFIAGILLSGLLLTSCASEENMVEQNAKTVEFAKTAEMINFESSLKLWFQHKRENKGNDDAKQSTQVSNKITEAAKKLLVSLGKSENEIVSKTNQSNDEVVRMAMKEYSKKLTEIYHKQINE